MSLGALLWGRETALATALKSEREREREHRKSGLKHGSVVDPARFSSGLQRTGEAVEQEMGPALHCRRPPLPQRRGATTATPSIVIPRSRPVGSSDTFRVKIEKISSWKMKMTSCLWNVQLDIYFLDQAMGLRTASKVTRKTASGNW
ncbi:hypothetical protein MUK42_03660 [Musa troglodytarum]|uniref:Uncharacterized protein n=1 Tax=Musa troglodytarum TaxID=320322 RepID=A0A9E7GMU4_9LILI|nr:hypothetical protein MUK42_03660 [Musa troglodytarum]URE18221.1 hypothetical protein MUK42_03660 [Musa troglodytarum]